MNQREAKRLGKERAYNIATWCDVPEVGKTYWTDSDGKVTVDEDNIWDVMTSLCYNAESSNRDYSPFEFTAHDINESRYPDELWAAYDEGVTLGIEKRVREARKAHQ